MFERYTEKARRVIFFARYEASQFGSPRIETEHLLLGLLREDDPLANRVLPPGTSVDGVRQRIEARTTIREKVSTSVDMPLSQECKRILAYAAEEAERLNHQHIGTEHLILGILRQEDALAATILGELGVILEDVRAHAAPFDPARISVAHSPRLSSDDPRFRHRVRMAVAKSFESRPGLIVLFDYPVRILRSGVRIPDISVVLGEATEPISKQPPFLCIEIVSNDDRFGAMQERVDDYLSTGVPYVWLLHPASRHAYSATSETGLREVKDQTLRTEHPPLELPLHEIFS